MIVVDEYLAVRVAGGAWPVDLPDDELVLPTSRHWRLLQALHGSRGGRLSEVLAALTPASREAIRYPHPEVFGILDPRPYLDEAAQIAARYGGTGWLTAEALVAGLAHGNRLYFGLPANVGRLLARAGAELGIAVHVVT